MKYKDTMTFVRRLAALSVVVSHWCLRSTCYFYLAFHTIEMMYDSTILFNQHAATNMDEFAVRLL